MSVKVYDDGTREQVTDHLTAIGYHDTEIAAGPHPLRIPPGLIELTRNVIANKLKEAEELSDEQGAKGWTKERALQIERLHVQIHEMKRELKETERHTGERP